jgi:hypothetical protein
VWYSQTHIAGERKNEVQVAVASLKVTPSAIVSDVIDPPPNVAPIVKRVPLVQILEVLPAAEPEVQLIDEPVAPESQASQIPMKFVTDDPDIIIYWLPSDKGD